jgi:hypothetical protein
VVLDIAYEERKLLPWKINARRGGRRVPLDIPE